MVNSRSPKRKPSSGRAISNRCTQPERMTIHQIRLFLRAHALKLKPDRLAILLVIAFRREFPQAHLANAYARGIPAYRKLLREEGGSLSSREAAHLFGITVRELRSRFRRGLVMGFEDEEKAFRFPAWQFTSHGHLPGMVEVLTVLNESGYMDDTGRILFFLTRFDFLNGLRPLDCLRRGDIQNAIRAAQSYNE